MPLHVLLADRVESQGGSQLLVKILPGHNCSIDFLRDAKRLSVVEKSAFTDILGEAMWSHT